MYNSTYKGAKVQLAQGASNPRDGYDMYDNVDSCNTAFHVTVMSRGKHVT